MGNSPRRIYIYPPLQQDDGVATGPFWPPGTSSFAQVPEDQGSSASSGYSESNVGQGGGLLGMLLRAMPQNRDQPGVDSGLASDGAPEVQYANYDGPQSGLLGRRAAPQSQQSPYQPFPESNGLPLSDPRNPNFRQLARIPVAGRPRDTNDTSDQSDERSSPSYFSLRDSNSPDWLHSTRQGDQGAQPDHSFSDRIQAYWDHPHPHGLVSALKQALDGIAQAVQGSIDATSVPSTEEEAFRQNLGREQGPVGAWKATSLLNPAVPRGTGGIFASPLVDAVTNRLPSMRADALIARQGSGEHTVAPGIGIASGNGIYSPGLRNSATAVGDIAASQGLVRNSMQRAPQPMGGLFGASGHGPVLPWIARAPEIQAGIDGIEAGRRRRRGPPPPKNVSLRDWAANKPAQTPSARNWGGSGSGGGRGGGGGGDDDDRCFQREREEKDRCSARWAACQDRAVIRRDLCVRNGGVYPTWGPREWDPVLDEEAWFNVDR